MPMLLSGFNHIATMTKDTERLCVFYEEVFEAKIVRGILDADDRKLTFIDISPTAQFNVFEFAGNTESDRQTPMFGRGRIDHFGLEAASLEAFEEIRRRLIDRGAADEFVTDFGPVLSVFFTDPDGLEGEVCVRNPDAEPGVTHPPGTPAKRYVS
jgi:catechol 2,3-dioxygenase-like lactoylglutathione lyase family enzyme